MSDFEPIIGALAQELGGRLGQTKVVRERELHCVFHSQDAPALAQLLCVRFEFELQLVLAADRRADRHGFEIHYLFSKRGDRTFVDAATRISEHAPALSSLAPFHYPASRFEREIADQFGIILEGHPDPRPLVRHGFWPRDYYPLRKDAGIRHFTDDGSPFPFKEVEGEGVYEIPVGPVHAGVIEPGHFRFSVVGETIIRLKSRLYFTHKGTEKLFEGRTPEAGIELAERISGDTTVGHALAYSEAVEALTHTIVPTRARYLRVLLLELERLYNHVGDFGAIANDASFAVAYSHCLRIRERLLRLNKSITGHRLMRGAVIPGGVTADVTNPVETTREVEDCLRDFLEIVVISLANTLLTDRLEGTGRLTQQTARDHGTLGFVARASGIDVDVRRDFPFAAYTDLPVRVALQQSGDVMARMLVRVDEARESVRLIGEALKALPVGALASVVGPAAAFEPAFGLVEGWRGAIVHWVLADDFGRLHRVKVLDPSFLNWPPLSYAILKNIVPDFPLCNKSFNQSYSGNDL